MSSPNPHPPPRRMLLACREGRGSDTSNKDISILETCYKKPNKYVKVNEQNAFYGFTKSNKRAF